MAEFQPASILGTADDPRSQWLTEALLELAECEIFRKLKSLDQPVRLFCLFHKFN
jgi:hypothetical protein